MQKYFGFGVIYAFDQKTELAYRTAPRAAETGPMW